MRILELQLRWILEHRQTVQLLVGPCCFFALCWPSLLLALRSLLLLLLRSAAPNRPPDHKEERTLPRLPKNDDYLHKVRETEH
jgi:hypothetical protein